MREFDTIASVATNIGQGGISIIRVSGVDSLKIVNKIFKSKNNDLIKNMKPYTMKYGYIVDENNIELDEVILSFMKGPKSFTAEDTMEINCHGGIVVTNTILEQVIKSGARLAEPGEFTKRAFLNGRIDLSQAEAVIDIINAKTKLGLKSAVKQSKGFISREIHKLREEILDILSQIEATVDYPEEDLEEVTNEAATLKLNILMSKIDSILQKADEGKIIRDGIKVVIVGKPNVGKSSLMNSLLKENRAIVTDIPGTTRDVIEEYINIEGIPVQIVDTAGIRITDDVIEKIGVEKSKEKIEEADLIIYMIDGSRDIEDQDIEIFNYIKDKKYVTLINKSDLWCDMKKIIKNVNDLLSNDFNIYNISAKSGAGTEIINKIIKDMFFSGEIVLEDVFITNTRHKEALLRCKENLIGALNTLNINLAIDLVSIDLRDAWTNLGEITGDTIEEDIVHKIFSKFCLGK